MKIFESKEPLAQDGFHVSDDVVFDPLSDLFVAQAVRPAHIGEVNLRTLTPFQRALLVIDGTVTKFIEAYTMEPVDVLRLSQDRRQLSEDHPWLEVPGGTDVVARQVLLRGRYSHRFYAYAVSLILPDRLGKAEQQSLEIEGEGLGRILLNSRLETRREVLWYGRERTDSLPDSIRELAGTEFISRMYRVIVSGKPVMLINERFPTGSDRQPSHH